jgi:hypothetical protein
MQPSHEFRLAAGMNDPAPANPSRRYRSTHLRTVRGQTPAACATASGVCPFATCRTIRSRPRGVSRAFLVHVHPVLPRNLKLQQPQLPRSEPDGQPTESSQPDHLTQDHRQQGPRDRSLARTDYERCIAREGRVARKTATSAPAFDKPGLNRLRPRSTTPPRAIWLMRAG